LGICPSTFDTTHTINFLCILARDKQSIDAFYIFFLLLGWDFPLTLAKIKNLSQFSLVFMRVKILTRFR
jgi:hypothetical protein